MSGNLAGLVIKKDGNAVMANPQGIDIIDSSSLSVESSGKEKSLIKLATIGGGGGGGSGGGGIGTYFGEGAPTSPDDDHNNGDYYFDTLTSPYRMYIQRSGVWVAITSPVWMSAMTGLPPDNLGSVNCFPTYMDGVFYLLIGDYTTNTTYIYTTTNFALWTLITTLTDVRPSVATPSQVFTNDGTNLYFISANVGDEGTKVYKSVDSGVNWTSANCPTINALDEFDLPTTVVGTFSRIVWNGTYLFIVLTANTYELPSERVWRSVDGVSWTMTTGLSTLNADNISAFGLSGSSLLIINKGGIGAYSIDNGDIWTTYVGTAIGDATKRNFDGNGTLVLNTTDVSIIKSATIGGAFSTVYTGTPKIVKRIADNHYMATLASDGLIDSSDSGDNWTAIVDASLPAGIDILSFANNGETAILVCGQTVATVYARI